MAEAKRDENRNPTLIGVDSSFFVTPTTIAVDPTTHEILVKGTLNTGDIQIGAVEIKNSTDDTRVAVTAEGLQVDEHKSTTPTVYNVTLTLANTEYSQALPANTREFRFRCRTLYDVRFAYVTGKVAGSTAPYLTLPAGMDYFSDYNNLSSQTLYFASSTAAVVVELEIFT